MKADAAPSSLPSPPDHGKETSGPGNETAAGGPAGAGMHLSRPLLAAIVQRWSWLAGGAVLLGLAGLLAGRALWSTRFTAFAQLIRHETPDPMLFQPRQINAPTLASVIESGVVRARVGAAERPPLSADAIGAMLRIVPHRGSDIIQVEISGNDLPAAIARANRYVGEAVRFTQELQSRDATEAARYLAEQLAKVDEDISGLNQKLRRLTLATPGAAISSSTPRPTPALAGMLEDARSQLVELSSRYTDQHPLMQSQRAKIAALERHLAGVAAGAGTTAASATTPAGATAAPGAAPSDDIDALRETGKSLESQRTTLTSRLRLTEMLRDTPPGYYRVFALASNEQAIINHPLPKILFLTMLGGFAGVFFAAAAALGAELLDPRLRTIEDVRRVTQLPVIAKLGDWERMPPAQQNSWAFCTWTALQHRLSLSPNLGLICGITSSAPSEGRSLWIRLLSEAANQCGFRVLRITTRPSPVPEELPSAQAIEGDSDVSSPAETTALALTTPTEIAEQLNDPNGPPVVHIPLPGWVWNLERRKEWQAALNAWRALENVVILVELPPASTPEAVLLAQNLPNLVWLADSTRARAPETRAQLATLRHARCNLVGAVLNRDTAPLSFDRFARWIPETAALCLLALVAPADSRAQAATAPDLASFALVAPAARADWQKRLTLGPGDILRFSLFGQPELTRTDVAIQPDGRVSYLEAQDVVATGLTVDELRARLDEALAQYRRAPRTAVTPVAFHSKKYFMLGRVAQKGAFTLDRPLTIVEAVARARGFETGLSGPNLVDLADFSRSFLVRGGARAAVDFEKLFAGGDLSQNIPVEPGDYFYFPADDGREVYLLGEVVAPGPVACNDQTSAVHAITGGAGFTPRAWRQRVLVVRGSLNRPSTTIVNVGAVLGGKQPDFKLEPGDIVYVSARPWHKAEELLDAAVSAFSQSVVVFWTTDNVIPIVR